MTTKALANLTPEESSRLATLEATINQGLRTFTEVGNALATIRDGRLYRATHKTFDAYCSEKWGWGASRARQLIGAAGVSKSVTRVTLSDEKAARALGRVPEKDRQKVADKAAETAASSGRRERAVLKAADIEKAAEAVATPQRTPPPPRPSGPPPRPARPVDHIGRPIHPKAAAAIEVIPEFAEIVNELHTLKRRTIAIADKPAGREINKNRQRIERGFKDLISAIAGSTPHTSCPLNENCTARCNACVGTQWITESQWNNVPREFRK